MDKKYQVFVSSTYLDLLDERKEVIQTLLELDCIPIGMELFPAADEDQWTFIKSVIDDCDYYVLILAGRYGSCSEDGISYTEMEYRYALETEKPIISFLHEDIGSIPSKFIEQDSDLSKKLKQFRLLTQKKLCKFWKTPTELAGIVGRSIVQLKKRSPAIGWVKADLVPNEGATQEILRLKNDIEKLNKSLASQSDLGIEISELSHGKELFDFKYTCEAKNDYFDYDEDEASASISWNTIFSALAPSMVDDADESALKIRLNLFVAKEDAKNIKNVLSSGQKELSASIDQEVFETIIIQFRALGLIQKSKRNRSVKDKQTYWCLTERGDNTLVGLRAIKKSNK